MKEEATNPQAISVRRIRPHEKGAVTTLAGRTFSPSESVCSFMSSRLAKVAISLSRRLNLEGFKYCCRYLASACTAAEIWCTVRGF
jgi:hypothetical protein